MLRPRGAPQPQRAHGFHGFAKPTMLTTRTSFHGAWKLQLCRCRRRFTESAHPDRRARAMGATEAEILTDAMNDGRQTSCRLIESALPWPLHQKWCLRTHRPSCPQRRRCLLRSLRQKRAARKIPCLVRRAWGTQEDVVCATHRTMSQLKKQFTPYFTPVRGGSPW